MNDERFEAALTPHYAISWRLFLTVAILASAMIVGLGLFAFLTYPTISDLAAITEGASVNEKVKAMTDARAAWSQQFITLAQTLLIGSLVPLLATIAAYALGERARETSPGVD